MRDLAVTADQLFDDLSRQHRDAGAPPLDVALGFYEVHQNRLYNSGLYATLGGPRRRHPPRPPQGLPADLRRLRRGAVRRGGPERAGVRHPLGPGRDAHLRGRLALVHADARRARRRAAASSSRARARRAASRAPSEAPGRPASLGAVERLAQDIAGEHGVYVALAQLVGFEGGKAFPGGSPGGGPAGRHAGARRRSSRRPSSAVTLDFEEITRARADLPLLADLEMRLPHLLGSLHDARRGGGGGGPADATPGSGRRRRADAGARSAGAQRPRSPPSRRTRPATRSPSTPSSPAAGWSSSSATRCSAGAGFERVVARPLGRRGQLAGGVPRRRGARRRRT